MTCARAACDCPLNVQSHIDLWVDMFGTMLGVLSALLLLGVLQLLGKDHSG